ncbi:MAG: hypothetical protein ACRCST_08845 [Turicibacter sp.]
MKGKKLLLAGLLVAAAGVTTACGQAATELFSYVAPASQIATWGPMVTPGGGEGSASLADNVAVVQAAADGWGGVQSEKMTLDLTKDPMLMVQVKESPDGCNWGVKFLPSDILVEGHEWGLYLFEDNNFKHNNYAATDLNAKLGEDFKAVYGDKVEGSLWIMAAGGPTCTVEVSEVKILDQK